MSPLLDQLLVAAAIVGAAAYFILRPILRRRAKRPACSDGCGCSSTKPGSKG